MDLNIKLNKDKSEAHAELELPLAGPHDQKVKVSTSDVRRAVRKMGYEVIGVIKGCVVHNGSESSRKGSWIIQIQPPAPTRPKVVVDKIEVAKADSEQGPPPRRRKKATSKKASD